MKNSKVKTQNFLLFSLTFAFCLLTFNFAVSAQEATGPAETPITDSVRDKVRKTIENLVRKPKAVVGNLTDISDSTLQIESKDAKTFMVATTEDTVYLRITNDKRSEIEFEDLVLLDFVIAMGHRNGNDVLEAVRVVTYDKSPISVGSAIYGTVQEVGKTTLTVKHPKKNTTWTVKLAKKATITAKGEEGIDEIDLSDIEDGDSIIAAGSLDKDDETILSARKIHVIPGNFPSPTPQAE
ncbi:hypothetical protein CMO96_02290 [Candidatus Woesebacteria bacterium]|nr:hypothetical protein [Candidatus Woesebacteria bacterium]|tara:strand:- start:231 stop:947 length:717 start_codon:yes stop_codon:yes gene_type:complete